MTEAVVVTERPHEHVALVRLNRPKVLNALSNAVAAELAEAFEKLDADGVTRAIVLTGDEERVGTPLAAARAELLSAGRRADVALDFEGLAQQDGRDMGSIARRSSTNWELAVTARTGHSSGIFSEAAGDGAATVRRRSAPGGGAKVSTGQPWISAWAVS